MTADNWFDYYLSKFRHPVPDKQLFLFEKSPEVESAVAKALDSDDISRAVKRLNASSDRVDNNAERPILIETEAELVSERSASARALVNKVLNLSKEAKLKDLRGDGEHPFPEMFDKKRKTMIPSRGPPNSPNILRLSSNGLAMPAKKIPAIVPPSNPPVIAVQKEATLPIPEAPLKVVQEEAPVAPDGPGLEKIFDMLNQLSSEEEIDLPKSLPELPQEEEKLEPATTPSQMPTEKKDEMEENPFEGGGEEEPEAPPVLPEAQQDDTSVSSAPSSPKKQKKKVSKIVSASSSSSSSSEEPPKKSDAEDPPVYRFNGFKKSGDKRSDFDADIPDEVSPKRAKRNVKPPQLLKDEMLKEFEPTDAKPKKGAAKGGKAKGGKAAGAKAKGGAVSTPPVPSMGISIPLPQIPGTSISVSEINSKRVTVAAFWASRIDQMRIFTQFEAMEKVALQEASTAILKDQKYQFSMENAKEFQRQLNEDIREFMVPGLESVEDVIDLAERYLEVFNGQKGEATSGAAFDWIMRFMCWVYKQVRLELDTTTSSGLAKVHFSGASYPGLKDTTYLIFPQSGLYSFFCIRQAFHPYEFLKASSKQVVEKHANCVSTMRTSREQIAALCSGQDAKLRTVNNFVMWINAFQMTGMEAIVQPKDEEEVADEEM